ncbi:POT family MFS transporter [Planctomicrobium piriforme]|uniref:Proton-dependent oligopeptide transporter, POT family n=1 Tax=Planctomicrobium piriforme TaxID=1576369 RepID=A0A1I3ST11_9PLAN|nr:POT family MFS transporter [Planctomicrobium piriforme]SFJ61480.1 proton-dependent oligopeptide transporter, POT family [Planctomicrobium piriforme]
MSEKKFLTVPPEQTTMPAGIPYIVGNEAAERFSYYGMKAILMDFMMLSLLSAAGQPDVMGEEEATRWISNFNSAVYFFPIIGAILADWLFGKYRMILCVSLVYCAGHATLALMDFHTGIDQRTLLFWGLCLIAIGSGGIKPCVSAHVGDQFGRANSYLMPVVFGWFYFAINFGSTFSTMLTPALHESKRFGPSWAFGVPGVLMGIATLVFWLGRNKFVHVPPAGNKFFKETFSREGFIALANLAPLYLLIAPFWSLFDQTGSRWVGQAHDMDRRLFGFEPSAAQFQVVNPIMVMIFIPLFSYVIYPLMRKFFTVTPLRRIGIGLFLTVPSFLVATWIESRILANETPSIGWQILAYALLTAAEVMVSITSLEFSYTQAPKEMKSFVMGVYLLSISLGNQFTSLVNSQIENSIKAEQPILQGANYFWFFSMVMLAAAVIFAIWSPFYRGRTYIQSDDQPQPEPAAT